ncbi:Secretory carrier-associated membrane protein 2, partial [Leucoagaricus sp. SymC.cos]
LGNYNENPFASSHSLDANPFDDPPQHQQASYSTRLEDIQRREADLERREAELSQKAEHIRKHGRNNWPFFYPLIYHSIQDEIPEVSRPLITRLYQLWLVLLGTLIINMVACLFVFFSDKKDGGSDLGASIGYIPVIGILSFLLWYRPIYNGYMKASKTYLHLYFFFGGFHLLFSVYMIIGVPSTGSAGLVQTIRMFIGHHWVAAVLGTVATVGWTIQGLGNAFYFAQASQYYRRTFLSSLHFDQLRSMQAKAELATHGAKAYFTRG